MQSWTFFTLLFSLAVANPGIQVTVSEATVNNVLSVVYLAELPAHFLVGNYSLELPSTLGTISANLTDIDLTYINLDSEGSVVTFLSPNYIDFTIQNLTIEGTAGYSLGFDGIKLTPGQANFSVSNTNITIQVSLSALDSRVQINVTGNQLALGNVTVLTQLPAAFDDLINTLIADQVASLETLIPSIFAKYVPIANEYLLDLDLVISLPVADFAIDLGVVAGPSINDNEMVIGLNGTILAGGQALPVAPPVSVPVPGVLTEGVQIALTDSVVNSLLAPIWSNFNYLVTSLPAFTGFSLDTTSLSLLLPQLSQTYGKNRPMRLNLQGENLEYFTDGDVNLDANATIEFLVYYRSNWQTALTLTFALSADLTVAGTNNVVNVEIVAIALNDLTVVQTAIGTINTSVLTTLLDDVILALIPVLNPLVQNIVRTKQPLALPGIIGELVTSDELAVETGYIVLGANILG